MNIVYALLAIGVVFILVLLVNFVCGFREEEKQEEPKPDTKNLYSTRTLGDTIKFCRSVEPGKVPDSLEPGEPAVNLSDGVLFIGGKGTLYKVDLDEVE